MSLVANYELPGTMRDIKRVIELREMIDRNPLSFAVQAERIERDKARLIDALREFLDLCPRMSDDDPIAPAVADHCMKVRAMFNELGVQS